jgi:hypothetical protein
MLEFLLAGATVVGLLALGAVALVPWEPLMSGGIALVVGGLGLGVPTGLVYHVMLYRALAARGPVDPKWIWRPFDFHNRIDRVELRPILPWAWAGAVGFVFCVLGCIAIVAAMVSVMFRGV